MCDAKLYDADIQQITSMISELTRRNSSLLKQRELYIDLILSHENSDLADKAMKMAGERLCNKVFDYNDYQNIEVCIGHKAKSLNKE